MKKTYTKIKLFIVLLSVVTINISAQLSGVYTINSAVPTGGNNFQTFAAFKTALNTPAGISGPVTVNVVLNSGPYLEQVDFPQVTGMNATNVITINGNGCTMSFAGTAASPWTFGISGGDFMVINNMNFVGTDGTYAIVGHIWNNSDNNTFNNCTFSTPANNATTTQSAFALSGTATSPTTAGDTGDNNILSGCTFSGGYYCVAMYGLTSSPYNVNNQILNCRIIDYHLYGIYAAYQRQMLIRGNTLERLTRTNLTTTYGILLTTGTNWSIVETNRIQKLFEGNPGFSATCYLLYNSSTSTPGQETIFRNNLVSLDKCIGTAYCIYNPGYSYVNFYHNTISVDSQTDAGALTVYGAYYYGTLTYLKNNNISITRSGSGTRYGIYIASTISPGFSNNNNIWVSSAAATNFYGYYFSTGISYPTQATWSVATACDANSYQTNPMFNNPAIGDYMPTSYVMNNGGQNLGVVLDINGVTRSVPTPDPGAWEYYNVGCTGTPTVNNVVTPTLVICPNSPVGAYLANSYTTSGQTFSWSASATSPVGPWNVVPPGTTTNAALSTTVGSSVLWYTALVTCTNSNQSIIAVSGSVNVAGTTFSTVPYTESFEGIGLPNRLPNCSWSASNIMNTCFTYTSAQTNLRVARTGSSYASFYYTPGGNSYFFTNGIQMEPGVTYSITNWYLTDVNNYTAWKMHLWVGPSQSTVGANMVATTGTAPAMSQVYKALTNTFTVPNSGIYYVGVHANANGTGLYMSWDDLSIIVPCSLNPTGLSVNAAANAICQGQAVNISANGCSSYLWSNGSTNNVINVSPIATSVYGVTGTNANSGCSQTQSYTITVNNTPQVYISAPSNNVCLGKTTTLTANFIPAGAAAVSYTWNTNAVANSIVASPVANITYSVLGSSAAGCMGMGTYAITVNLAPTVSFGSTASGPVVCADDEITLSGIGATTYQWLTGNTTLSGNPVVVSPNSTTTYTMVGTTAQGCSATLEFDLEVTACTGINSISKSADGIRLYPNPSNGVFTIQWNNGLSKTAQVIDVTGRMVINTTSSDEVMTINMSNFANGIYYVKLISDNTTEVVKIVKQ